MAQYENNGNGVWLRWVVGLLFAIILIMAGAWATDVRTTQKETSNAILSIDKRLTRIEYEMGIPQTTPRDGAGK